MWLKTGPTNMSVSKWQKDDGRYFHNRPEQGGFDCVRYRNNHSTPPGLCDSIFLMLHSASSLQSHLWVICLDCVKATAADQNLTPWPNRHPEVSQSQPVDRKSPWGCFCPDEDKRVMVALRAGLFRHMCKPTTQEDTEDGSETCNELVTVVCHFTVSTQWCSHCFIYL